MPDNNSKFVQITSEEAFWSRQGVHGERLIHGLAAWALGKIEEGERLLVRGS